MRHLLTGKPAMFAVCAILALVEGCSGDEGVPTEGTANVPSSPCGESETPERTSQGLPHFETCDGVSYPDSDPDEFADRPTSPSCGQEGVGERPDSKNFVDTIPDPEARSCLLEAWSSGASAELSTARPTIEGPILVVLRALESGEVERYELDPFGRGPIVQLCSALRADGEALAPGAEPPAATPERLDAAECDAPDEVA